MKRAAVEELNGIVTATADLGGRLRQFEMRDSRDYQRAVVIDEFSTLQEHVSQLYGMVQRLAVIILEES